MRRWHEETALMLRRWKKEMELHGYDWRNPPTDPSACHCARGIGSQRKTRQANGCRCEYCLGLKRKERKHKRAAIQFELDHS